MPSAIDGLEPQPLWKHFAALSRIPRGSKNEAAAAQFVLDTARQLALPARQDAIGNVLVVKPAAPGNDRMPSVCLQSHLDMVCEKNADKVHDFTKDPIELVRDGDVVRANGTTLGADNGVGVAAALAVAEDRSLEHGPLELLFTIDEETGLTGAHNLEPGFVRSRILLNLDSETEGEICVGCAGGLDTLGTWNVAREPARPNAVALELGVTGLRGGHSGVDIDKGRGNALKIAGRVLIALAQEAGARVVSIRGGGKPNAIPREAFATFCVPRSRATRARKLVGRWEGVVREELGSVEPDLRLRVAEAAGDGLQVLKRKSQKQILQTISALPHGVIKMSAAIPELVETSTNVAVITTQGDTVSLATSQRSSVASEIEEITQTVRTIFELGRAAVSQSDGYPGWKPNMESPTLKRALATYASLFGREPDVRAVHAGLECGIIGETYPGIDMISFGPTVEEVHTPEERIVIDTVPRFWGFLTALLKAVA
ncbi:MAG: aminoacyl-histidine dipeptidase [Acidobacteria bacterium]|nr:aminoacyl-histidine dipeptidase [Acidobacteriota bacterium]